MSRTSERIEELGRLSALVAEDADFIERIDTISERIVAAYRAGAKTIFCGNGGSSAEAQHLAAELSGRFRLERAPIPAEACHVNSSFVTAVSNDYDFTRVYARYIDGFGQKSDVLIGLSTSGTSPNMVEAFKAARKKGIVTVAFTGQSGGALAGLSDFILKVPSTNVPRIQEIHLLIGHIICEHVEQELFENDK